MIDFDTDIALDELDRKGENKMICGRCGGTGRIESFLLGKEIDCARCNSKGYIGGMTNEEWLRSASTEELADFLAGVAESGRYLARHRPLNGEVVNVYGNDYWENWLKEKHHE